MQLWERWKGHGWTMYIMYLSVNREGKLECKCGVFIVNAVRLLYTSTVVLKSPLLFGYYGFLFYYLQSLLPWDFFFHNSLQSLKLSVVLETNSVHSKICHWFIWYCFQLIMSTKLHFENLLHAEVETAVPPRVWYNTRLIYTV